MEASLNQVVDHDVSGLDRAGYHPRLSASPIEAAITYTTSGTVQSYLIGPHSPPLIGFTGVEAGSQTSGQALNIGEFYYTAFPVEGTLSVPDLTFQIIVNLQTINGVATVPNDAPIVIDGSLSGTITPDNIDLNAVYPFYGYFPENPPAYPTSVVPFRTGDYLGYLCFEPSKTNSLAVEAVLNIAPVPEPTSMLVFAAAAGLVVLRPRQVVRD